MRRLPSRAVRIVLWIVLGLLLRTVVLGGNGLWMDEGYTAWTAHLPAEEHWTAVRNDDAPPLYYALQRGIVPHLPPNEASVRLLSAAAGVAGTIWLAVQSPVQGLVEQPVAFLALGTFGVYHSRQARSYAVLMLWGLILMTATARVLEGRRRWFAVVALAEGLALWTHNVAVNLVIGANLAWLLCGRRDVRRWSAAQAGAFLIWLPYLVLLFRDQLAIHGKLNVFIETYWEKIPLAVAPLLSLGAFTSGASLRAFPSVYRWSYDGPFSTTLAVAAFAAVALLLLAAFRKGQRRKALFAAAFTLGPLVSLTILSIITVPSYTVGRTDAIAYGGFALWTGLGFRGLPRLARWPVAAVLLLTTVLATANHLPIRGQARENDRLIGQQLRREAQPGDWIAYVGASQPSIDYYVSGGRPGRPDTTFRRVLYPAIFQQNPASDHPITGDSLDAWETEALHVRDRFEAESGSARRRFFWVGPIEPRVTGELTASDLLYPGSMLAYAVNGLRPLNPMIRLRGDELSIDWLVFWVESDSLIPREELLPVEAAD